MGSYSKLGAHLYSGERSFDFIGNRRRWYAASLLVVVAALSAIWIKGLNLGIEFTGGEQVAVTLPAERVTQETADDLRETVAGTGIDAASAPIVVTQGTEAILVQTEPLTADETSRLLDTIQEDQGVQRADLSSSEISASFGAEVAQRAMIGIAAFLVFVVLLIWAWFREWKMSVAALVALFHDLSLTIGIYALSGFNVTPAAVTGILAILAFSLYDTVVVFDKVRENTKNLGQSRTTYAGGANLAVNQTLVRSVNTSVVALLPIGAILYVSATALGASSLQDLALAQFVGSAVGVFSSVCVAPRVLVHLKSTESAVKIAERRDRARERHADRYAHVPAAVDEGQAQAEQGPRMPYAETDPDSGQRPEPEPEREEMPGFGGSTSSEAMGKGRTRPSQRRPVDDSRASGRKQPVRQTKKQRKKD